MKRTWQNWLAIATLVTLAGTANAQNSWNQPSEIGSYQSILSRAGYGNEIGSLSRGASQSSTPIGSSAGIASQGGAMYGVAGTTAVQSAPAMPAAQSTCSSGCASGLATQGGMGMPMTTGQIMSAPPGSSFTPAMQTAPVIQSSPVTQSATVMTAPPAISAPMLGGLGANYVGSTPIGSPAIYESPLLGGTVSSACAGPVYSSPVVQQSVVSPVYTPRANRPRANYTVGLFGMFFQRDYEDNRYLASDAAGGTLFTNDADDQTFDGYGVNFASRSCNGGGFEAVYWSLNPGRTVAFLNGGNVATSIQGFDQLLHVSTGRDLYDIYSTTVAQTIVRDTDIHNLEFNLLRNGGTFTTRRNRRGFYELLGGFRWFEFDENLQYTASLDPTAYPGSATDFFYNLGARNRLLGVQLGARNEYCLGSKLRLFSGVKGGLFNNNIRTVHNLTDSNGEIAQVNGGPAAGRPFSYPDEKNDLAFLGELDLGILYHLSSRSRLRFGYRVLGVSGVALAADQMAYNYADPTELTRAMSNGSLILGGGYYGMEFCF